MRGLRPECPRPGDACLRIVGTYHVGVSPRLEAVIRGVGFSRAFFFLSRVVGNKESDGKDNQQHHHHRHEQRQHNQTSPDADPSPAPTFSPTTVPSMRSTALISSTEAPAVSYVCDGLRRVFETHGATPVAPPTIRPKPPPSLAAPPAASKGLVRLLDHKGAVVTLPGNLTAPFARFVARSGVTRLKRYQIDRIFLAAGPERSCTEAWEADFDIISSSSSSAASASSPFYGAGYSTAAVPRGGAAALDDARGSGGGSGGNGGSGQGDHFEVAEAEAVLVVSQVFFIHCRACGG